MVKHLLTLSLALTLIWGCDGKKSGTKTAETKSAEAKTVTQGQPQQASGNVSKSVTAAKKKTSTATQIGSPKGAAVAAQAPKGAAVVAHAVAVSLGAVGGRRQR